MRLTILFKRKKQFARKPHSGFTRSIEPYWLSNKQETRRPKETQFSVEKKMLQKRENRFTLNSQNIASLDGCYEAIDSSISQDIFSYLKMFSMQCIKNITVENNIKRMNMTNFIYLTKMTQNKNDSMNSCYWQ